MACKELNALKEEIERRSAAAQYKREKCRQICGIRSNVLEIRRRNVNACGAPVCPFTASESPERHSYAALVTDGCWYLIHRNALGGSLLTPIVVDRPLTIGVTVKFLPIQRHSPMHEAEMCTL